MRASCGFSCAKTWDMAGLLTGGGAESKRGPGQCGYGGRGQVSAGSRT